MKRSQIFLIYCLVWCVFFASKHAAMAQSLPNAADVNRIQKEKIMLPKIPELAPIDNSIKPSSINVPDNAKSIHFTLKKVIIKGNTAFTDKELLPIFASYLGKDITLDVAWHMAGGITERYRQQHYFLSRAYIPAQEIEDGTLTIAVIEGYIGSVSHDSDNEHNKHMDTMIADLLQQRPISSKELESFMLRANDLPAVAFQGVILPDSTLREGAVKLLLKSSKDKARGAITVDNYGSRFLGPYQSTALYQRSFLPNQLTTLSVATSLPTNELAYGGVNHDIALSPSLTMLFNGSYVSANPGYTLKQNDIHSEAIDVGIGVRYQAIRQRQENLALTLKLTGKNTSGDIFKNVPLTRDRIRKIEASVAYDATDTWQGYNQLSATLNQGLSWLGSSSEGLPNLSRADADPSFTSVLFSYDRNQAITEMWGVRAGFAGQLASAPLFSSEEFGIGGQRFGRAYDPSELLGDNGIAGSLELNYYGIGLWHNTRYIPFVFYDHGAVWNKDKNGKNESASSAGLGVRIAHESGVSASVGLAWPLTRDIDNPIYGNGKNPRLMTQFSYGF